MNTGGVVLHKILLDKDLDQWSKLKGEYFSAELRPAFRAISKFYDSYNKLPTFEDLALVSRNQVVKNTILLLESLEVPEVELELAVDALIDEYVQDTSLAQLDHFIDDVTVLNQEEIINRLQEIVLDIEEVVHTSSEVYEVQDIDVFEEQEDMVFVPVGLNNQMDRDILGLGLSEVAVIGGFRGSGKSLTCSNIQMNEYLSGFVCPYFTIEMRAKEVFLRNLAIEAGVHAGDLRKGRSTESDRLKVLRAMANRYENGEQIYSEFLSRKKYDRTSCIEFERRLRKLQKKFITDPIIDNSALSIVDIDLHLQKLKSKYADKMRIAVVDYVNKVTIPGMEDYDWKTQLQVTAKLKHLADKYDIAIWSPFQIDESGKVKFSKSILDAVDLAMNLKSNRVDPVEEGRGYIDFEFTKQRHEAPKIYSSVANFHSLKIGPEVYVEESDDATDLTSSEDQECPF